MLRHFAPMLMFLALAAAAATETPPRVASTAEASVRLLHAQSASKKDWEAADTSHKREILVRESDGRMTRVRLIEHE